MTRIGRLASLLGVLFVMASSTALAQVPGEQGFFGSIDGRWMWLGGDPVVTAQGTSGQTANAPSGQMMLGYKVSPHWDFALSGDVQGLMTQLTKFQNGTLSVDNNHQHFNLEAGYSDTWWRVNAGLRGIHYQETIGYNFVGFSGYDYREIYGIGPKIGAGARWGLSDNWALIGSANAALLYASYADSGNAALLNSGSYGGLVPQLDGEIGVNWRSDDSPNFSVTVGGRAAASFNTAITSSGTHKGTLVDYGPFMRLAYNFAGRTPAAVASPPPAPATAAVPGGYLVFFDFDRADLSPVASSVVRQAADDARRGRPASIEVTGHADRAGAEDYNRALSLRRANAVKTELVRLGLSDAQISVAGRGESEPLVPTADGVREARNRRVQISF